MCWFDNKVNCGCNIHPNITDYGFIWEIVDQFQLKHLRVSVVSPSAQYEHLRSDKEAYYNLMKPRFIQFCQDAKAHDCHLGIDCSHIPSCYFNNEEKELVLEVCGELGQDFYEPVVDINPEFKATACFGAYDPVDIWGFNNEIELRNYLLFKKTWPRVQANCTGRCSTCKKHELIQCQGGCLGFASVERF